MHQSWSETRTRQRHEAIHVFGDATRWRVTGKPVVQGASKPISYRKLSMPDQSQSVTTPFDIGGTSAPPMDRMSCTPNIRTVSNRGSSVTIRTQRNTREIE